MAPSEQVLSRLSPDQVQALGGLPREAIAGVFVGEAMRVDDFRPNPAFVEFMHDVIRTAGPVDRDLRAAAQARGEGWVYIIDLRTTQGPGGAVPPEDLIGAFEVRNGSIVAGSYQANNPSSGAHPERSGATASIAAGVICRSSALRSGVGDVRS
jgi:hypothetical protein